MNISSSSTVLFTGYAPVHFLCFQPLYRKLLERKNCHVFFSGGTRRMTDQDVIYDLQDLYGPFDIPRDKLLTVKEIQTRDFDILITANTRTIAPRNVRKRIQIFHGISYRNKAIRPENMNNDHFFIIGPYMHRRFLQAGLLGDDDPRALKIGFPKTDRLLNGELDRREWLAKYGFDGQRPVVLYAPTGQRFNSMETMGENVILRLKHTRKYDLMVKPHDHPKDNSIDWFSRLGVFEDEHLRLVRDRDVIPHLFLADLLITDASSVSAEYALLNRPMVFLDVPALLERSMKKDPMLDLSTWGRRCGEIVNRPEEAVGATAQSLSAPEKFEIVRKEMVSDIFYNPGKATVAADAWWQSMIAELMNVPVGIPDHAARA